MKQPSPGFQRIIFALFLAWFFVLAVSFFVSRPITLVGLMPEVLLLVVFTVAAYSLGSIVTEALHLEDILLPTEEFVLATTMGLGALPLLAVLLALLGFLTWWTVGLGLIAIIITGFNRIVGMATPPTYLFGPEDLGEEAPDPITWLQYIVVAIWLVALIHFTFLPPACPSSLEASLGAPGQWALTGSLPGAQPPARGVSLSDGLFALALALRGVHLAMFLSGLSGGLALGALYLCAKRYCGPLAARSTFLAAASLPLFLFSILSPGEHMVAALFEFCAFFCLMRWYDDDHNRWATLIGIFIGLGLAASPLALFYLPPLLCGWIVWTAMRRRLLAFLAMTLRSLLVAALVLLPWALIAFYLDGSPFAWAGEILRIEPPPIALGLLNILKLPLSLSFPHAEIPPFEVIGPIFLVFVPFFFVTYRKNPLSGLATAIGLAFLGFGEPFGLPLGARMAALMLLAVPVSMAAHRFVERTWPKGFAVILLYVMIGWQIFHATAMVETIYPSPHRFLLGLETSEEFLEKAVPYYSAAESINEVLPGDARILALGHRGLLYFERRITVPDAARAAEIAGQILHQGGLGDGLAALRKQGYTHLLIDPRIRPRACGVRLSREPEDPLLAAVVQRLLARGGLRSRQFISSGITLFSLGNTSASAAGSD